MNREHIPNEGEMKDIWDRLTKSESSIKSAHHRIDELKDLSVSINNLAISTERIATETKELREDYARADKRIEILESRPIKNYNIIVTSIITAVCSGLAGFFLNAVLK